MFCVVIYIWQKVSLKRKRRKQKRKAKEKRKERKEKQYILVSQLHFRPLTPH
jgi:hypothetical protein